MYACMKRNEASIKLLLEFGADWRCTNIDEHTALDLLARPPAFAAVNTTANSGGDMSLLISSVQEMIAGLESAGKVPRKSRNPSRVKPEWYQRVK